MGVGERRPNKAHVRMGERLKMKDRKLKTPLWSFGSRYFLDSTRSSKLTRVPGLSANPGSKIHEELDLRFKPWRWTTGWEEGMSVG